MKSVIDKFVFIISSYSLYISPFVSKTGDLISLMLA